MDETPLPVFLTVTEVAKIFRVSKMTVYRMCHTGEIESTTIGKSFRIYTASLLRTHITEDQIRNNLPESLTK